MWLILVVGENNGSYDGGTIVTTIGRQTRNCESHDGCNSDHDIGLRGVTVCVQSYSGHGSRYRNLRLRSFPEFRTVAGIKYFCRLIPNIFCRYDSEIFLDAIASQ